MMKEIIKENKIIICYKSEVLGEEYFVKKVKVLNNIKRPIKLIKNIIKIFNEKRKIDINNKVMGYNGKILPYLNSRLDIIKIVLPYEENYLKNYNRIKLQLAEAALPKVYDGSTIKVRMVKLFDILFFLKRTIKYIIKGEISLLDDWNLILSNYSKLLELLKYDTIFTIHADFHPGNIIFTKNNSIKLIDWDASILTVAFIAYDSVRFDYHPDNNIELLLKDIIIDRNEVDGIRFKKSYELSKYLEIQRRSKIIMTL